jgi:hypothetical protein
MIQTGGGAGFSTESLQSLAAGDEIGKNDLESDYSIQFQMGGFIDRSHPALSYKHIYAVFRIDYSGSRKSLDQKDSVLQATILIIVVAGFTNGTIFHRLIAGPTSASMPLRCSLA